MCTGSSRSGSREAARKEALWIEDASLPARQHDGTSSPKPTLATHVHRKITDLSLSAGPKTKISDAQKHRADDVSKPMLTLT